MIWIFPTDPVPLSTVSADSHCATSKSGDTLNIQNQSAFSYYPTNTQTRKVTPNLPRPFPSPVNTESRKWQGKQGLCWGKALACKSKLSAYSRHPKTPATRRAGIGREGESRGIYYVPSPSSSHSSPPFLFPSLFPSSSLSSPPSLLPYSLATNWVTKFSTNATLCAF